MLRVHAPNHLNRYHIFITTPKGQWYWSICHALGTDNHHQNENLWPSKWSFKWYYWSLFILSLSLGIFQNWFYWICRWRLRALSAKWLAMIECLSYHLITNMYGMLVGSSWPDTEDRNEQKTNWMAYGILRNHISQSCSSASSCFINMNHTVIFNSASGINDRPWETKEKFDGWK